VVLVCLLNAVLPSVNSDGAANGYFSFKDTSVYVEESARVNLNIQRRSGKDGTVLVACQVSHSVYTCILAISELRKGLGPSENINLIMKQTPSHERSP
jgi:hypothetical protein